MSVYHENSKASNSTHSIDQEFLKSSHGWHWGWIVLFQWAVLLHTAGSSSIPGPYLFSDCSFLSHNKPKAGTELPPRQNYPFLYHHVIKWKSRQAIIKTKSKQMLNTKISKCQIMGIAKLYGWCSCRIKPFY